MKTKTTPIPVIRLKHDNNPPCDIFIVPSEEHGPCNTENCKKFMENSYKNLKRTGVFSEVLFVPYSEFEARPSERFYPVKLCRHVVNLFAAVTMYIHGPRVCSKPVLDALRPPETPVPCPAISKEPEEASATRTFLLIFSLMTAIIACLVLAKRRQDELQQRSRDREMNNAA